MSIIFQLFCAEDLKQLTPKQLDDLRDIVGQEVRQLQDTFLEASVAISGLIQASHMQSLLPTTSYPIAVSPPSIVNISQRSATDFDQRALDRLRERVREVFQQLTGELPTGPSHPLDSPKLTSNALLNQLLNQADLDKLEATAGPRGREILAWALTCELANFNTYKAFERVKQRAEDMFIQFMKEQGKGEQRPKGPDTAYSPFYPGNPLYPYRSGANP
jgi:hypothetical protein